VPSGIKSIAPIRRQPAWGRLNPPHEHFSLYGSEDLMAKIQPARCWQYKPGDILAIGPLNWDEMIDEDDDDDN